MTNRFAVALPLAGFLCVGAPAGASSEASVGYMVHLTVPVVCQLHHQPGFVAAAGGAYRLGELQEYCNAPSGYQVMVSYAPGSMRGAVVGIGDEHVTLDGSGSTLVSRAPGPRIRERAIEVVPGANGFDTDRLNFDIVAQ